MNDLPNPLTPIDCDLRDFGYMPLDVVRLRDSSLAMRSTGDEFRCAVLLWCAAWHQVPAGSLPDDDIDLANYAGFGRVVDAWRGVKDGALRGWIKCTDGRLYHPVVAEKANEAYLAKHKLAYDKLTERIRKRNKGRPENGLVPMDLPEFEAWIEMGRPLERDLFPAEFPPTSGGKVTNFRRKSKDVPPEGDRSGPDADSQSGAEQPSGMPENGSNLASDGNMGASAGSGDLSAGNAGDFRRKQAGIPPENSLKGEERRGTEYVNPSGGGTAQQQGDASSDDHPNAAAAFVEILRREGVSVAASDECVASWPLRGATREDVLTAVATARQRRAKDGSTQPINVGFLDRILSDAIAARSSNAGGAPRVAGDWWRSWAGIVERGRQLGHEQGTDEHAFEFKLRVFRAAGDGPWWDDHNRAFRNNAGPVAAGALLGEGR
ncbi:DUF1376 domain-containing protein [Burkholderia ubonensis]|uniref:DUF1376 domain-containing protein n=1 Tax=Burkholderia ubonensis TaxID=101571 RepID=UPI000A929841|nr:DUF1376 domain-containing protein [Burkholderia ubonensis]